MRSALDRHYDELLAKVDAFFARTRARYAGALECAPGCTDCCRGGLTLTGIEAEYLRRGIATLPPEARRALAQRAEAPGGAACPALEPDGCCGVYAWRPLVCRTHGLPIRFRRPGSLPLLDACPKNFRGYDLAEIDADCVLDQQTLSTLLGALDAAHADVTGHARGERVALADVLKDSH